jgi:ADP-ribose pyrophosphatase YjhB (NUDIX family)
VTTTYYASDAQVIRLSVSAVVRPRPGAAELLLMRRSDNGLWGLPGGYVEVGESVCSAVAREVREETGVEVRVGRLVGVYSDPGASVIAYPDGRRVQAVNLCFEALALARAELGTPEETLGTGYFRFDALPERFVPIHAVRVQDALAGAGEARVR